MQPHVSRIVPLLISPSVPTQRKRASPTVQVGLALFGGFSLYMNNKRLSVSRQHASLISYLVRQRGAEISRDRLAALYWGDSPTEQARRNLRVALSRIKRLLSSNVNGAVEKAELLRASMTAVCMSDDASIFVDANLFESLVHNNCDIKHLSETKVANIQEAVNLYKECLLPEFDDEWVVTDRENLRSKYVIALRTLVYHYITQHDFVAAVAWVMRILHEEPYDESLAILAMRLLCFRGQRACAIKVYRSLSHQLRTEFGLSPSVKVAELFQLIAHDSPCHTTFDIGAKELAALLQVSVHCP
jgi:DNA-binding SARP family transcriptional activator